MDLNKQKIEFFKKWRKEYKLLLLIFLFGLSLRLLGLINISLAGDNLLHWKIAGDIAGKGIFPLLGPKASINANFNLGPFYYYLLSIPYFIGHGNFKVAVVFFSVLSSLSIVLLYFVSLRWFSKKHSLEISLLYATSAYMISIGNFPWNPYILPLFILLSLYFINKIKDGKFYYLSFFSLSYSFCLQAHATSIFLLPVFLYLLPFKKLPAKHIFLSLLTLILANFPWIYFSITTNFSQINAALSIFFQTKNEQCSFSYWFINHGHGEHCFAYFRNTLFAFRFITMSLFNTTNILVVFLSVVIIAAFFIKTKIKENKFLLIWLLIPILIFLTYSNFIYLHYFLILTPLPFFLFVAILSKIEKYNIKELSLSVYVIFLLVIFNIFQYINSLGFPRG